MAVCLTPASVLAPVVASIDHVDRARERLRVALHLGRELTHLRWMREGPIAVGHDADRQSHEGNSMQLAPTIFAEEITGSAILLVVLERDQRVEYRQDLGAHQANIRRR